MSDVPEAVAALLDSVEQEGENKVVPLAEAVARHLAPRDVVLLDRRTGAVMREILRRYRGQQPELTLVAASIANDALSLVHARLIRRLVCGVAMHRFPSSGPARLLQDAVQSREIEMENWSLVALNRRLEAAALGLPFLPTRSMRGSPAADENPGALRTVEDPFGSRTPVVVVRPLRPDVAFVHALAADRYGNAVLPAPLEDTRWGPRAARKVVLTTERLVPTSFIRRQNGLASLPGWIVTSVSVVPFGAHPEGMPPIAAAGLSGYREDYAFMTRLREASETYAGLEAWLEQWVYGDATEEAYRERLGSQRLDALVDAIAPDDGRTRLAAVDWAATRALPWTENEMMIAAAARLIVRRVRAGGFRTLLVGIGPIFLAGELAYQELRQEGYGLDLLMGSGEVGYEPSVGDPNLMSAGLVPSCKLLPDGADLYSFYVGGAGNACLSVVGGMQVDGRGNVNSTRIGDRFMTGIGGVNDAGNAREALVIARHARRTLVEDLSHVTMSGEAVRSIVTDRAIFARPDAASRFVLTDLLPRHDVTGVSDALARAAADCAWSYDVAGDPSFVSAPTDTELLRLRALDIDRVFL